MRALSNGASAVVASDRVRLRDAVRRAKPSAATSRSDLAAALGQLGRANPDQIIDALATPWALRRLQAIERKRHDLGLVRLAREAMAAPDPEPRPKWWQRMPGLAALAAR